MSLLTRKLLLIIIDSLFIIISIFLSVHLYSINQGFDISNISWIYFRTIFIGILLYATTGQYKAITRYVGSIGLYTIAIRNIALVFIVFFTGLLTKEIQLNQAVWIEFWLILTSLTGSVRFFFRDILLFIKKSSIKNRRKVIIYGAGDTGIQLAASIKVSSEFDILYFLDKNPNLWNRNLNGIQIKPPHLLKALSSKVDIVLLAIPSLDKESRREIVQHIQNCGLAILQIPSFEELASGGNINDILKPVQIDDLLGRDLVPPDKSLLGPGIINKTICITGAGGSIGSELCKQILKLNPKKIILVENCEYNLYQISLQLKKENKENIEILEILGSTTDPLLIKEIFNKHSINIIFHASAYKHVALVESNPLNGLSNNILSTFYLCNAAKEFNIEKFVLISSDKAVRPTNAMGASKRFSEIICKYFAMSSNNICKYSSVRFGNVLGSSGSVVPLFKNQIKVGGPITVTDKKVMRYFMTIEEAVQLVIQSSFLSTGGDTFLLDMGEPISIYKLAEQMIKLSGKTIKNSDNPDGNIEIKIIGLKPGEKIYEELLINKKTLPTKHKRIFKADEGDLIPNFDLYKIMDKFENAAKQRDLNLVLNIMKTVIPEWQNKFD